MTDNVEFKSKDYAIEKLSELKKNSKTGIVYYKEESEPPVYLNKSGVRIVYSVERDIQNEKPFDLQYREPATSRWESVETFAQLNEAKSEAEETVKEIKRDLELRLKHAKRKSSEKVS